MGSCLWLLSIACKSLLEAFGTWFMVMMMLEPEAPGENFKPYTATTQDNNHWNVGSLPSISWRQDFNSLKNIDYDEYDRAVTNCMMIDIPNLSYFAVLLGS